jgi:hypothetical protein
MRWAGHVALMVAKRNTYRILVGKSKRKRPLERPRHMWVDNSKMDLREIGLRIGTSGRLVMNVRVL